jgi:hypothetical protein
MDDPERRRLTITDAMILVAGAALGLVGVREVYTDTPLPRSGYYVGWVLYGPSRCVVAALAVTLILLNLRRPRPRRRRLVILPGFVACVVTLVALVLGYGCDLFFESVQTRSPGVTYTRTAEVTWTRAAEGVPEFVLGAWLGLWLTGRWAPEPSWIDRAGQAIGLFWIAGVVWRLAWPIVYHFAPML